MAAKSKRKNNKKKKPVSQSRLEIWGVICIALGLFLGVSLYSEAVGVVGVAISKFIFGMFGLFSYAIPVAFVAGGILLIVNAKDNFHKSSIVLAVIGLWLIVSVIHIATRPSISNVDFLKYGNDAYLLGQTLHKGGGIFGAIPAWPVLYLLGEAGAYIFFIAAFIIIVLVITKISLRSAGKKVGTQIKKSIDTISAAAEEHRSQRQSLYTEDLEAEQTELDFSEHQPTRKRQNKSKPAAPAKKPAADIPVKTKKEWDGDIDFIPTSGPIERQKKRVSAVNEEDPFGFESLFVPNPEPVIPEEPELIPVALEEEPPVNYAERITQFVQEPEMESVQEDLPIFKSTAEPVVAVPKKSEEVSEVENIEPIPPAVAVYQRPPFNLLNAPKLTYSRGGDTPEEKAKLLLDTLASFNITAKLLNISVGPVITRYELQPAQGIRVNRITALADDLALALAAPRVRIEAPIPGKAAIGIEVPNRDTATVLLREIIESKEFMSSKSSITFALGKDIAGNIAIADLDRMPHLLIAGATGSGKSVCINDIIISMIYKSSPADLRLILVDPKVVELRMFSVLPHLLVPVVTEPKKAAGALRWAVMEMEERYKKMAKLNVRSLAGYNAIQENPQDKMPKLVIIIDELADLMMVASKDVEESICRIAQLGRACGIHLIVATQRPSADIITGLIKANIPSRIAFAVSSAIDSRVIMDTSGAEKLLGRGDMLFHANGAGKPIRVQGAFVSDEEVERISNFFEGQQTESGNAFDASVLEEISTASSPGAQGGGKQEDELLPEAVKIVLDSGQASISMIQRRLRVGYARAARLVDIMEQMHIVSGFDGSKPRKLLIDQAQYEQMFGSGSGGEEV